MKRLLGMGVIALALAGTAGCAARGFAYVGPPVPPPPPREIAVTHFRAGLVWVPGHYRWTGRHYVWVAGRWVRPPRPGLVWVPGYWATRRGGYVWVEGYWR